MERSTCRVARRPADDRPRSRATTTRFDELAVGWALHALEPEDEAVFVGHLPGCERCARDGAGDPRRHGGDGRRPSGGRAVGGAAAPAGRRSRRDRAGPGPDRSAGSRPAPAAAAPPADGARPPRCPRRRQPGWRRVLPTGLVAAAVAAILGLGVWNVVLARSQHNLQSTVAEQSQVMNALLTPGQAAIAPLSDNGRPSRRSSPAATGSTWSPTGCRSTTRRRSTYVLWGMQGNTPVALGTFDVVRSRMDLRTVGSGQAGLDRYSTSASASSPGGRLRRPRPKWSRLGEVTS